jgi:DNA-binding transcriptional ArsR family regulator
VESVFEIIAEPNRRAILSFLVSSQHSVGEIERQLRMPQPTVSKHLRVLREAGFVESTVDAQRRLYRLKIGTTSGGGRLAGSVPPVLVRSRGCSRTPPRPHGSFQLDQSS